MKNSEKSNIKHQINEILTEFKKMKSIIDNLGGKMKTICDRLQKL